MNLLLHTLGFSHPFQQLGAVFAIDAIRSVPGEQVAQNFGTGGAALDAQYGSTPGVDTNDPVLLTHAGTNYLYLPGINPNNAYIPDAANLQPTVSMSYRSVVALDDYSPSTSNVIGSQWTTGSQKCWILSVTSSGFMEWRGSVDGASQAIITSSDQVTTVATDGTIIALRSDWSDAGEVVFYTKPTTEETAGTDARSDIGWQQLGSVITASVPTGALFDSTEALRFGAHGGTSFLTGRVYSAALYVDGALVVDVDFTTNAEQLTFVCNTGQTVTIFRNTTGRKAVMVTRPVWLFGTDDFLNVADSPLLNFANPDDFTLLAVFRDWRTDATLQPLIGKRSLPYTPATDPGYFFGRNTADLSVSTSDGTTLREDKQSLDPEGTLSVGAAVRSATGDTLIAYVNNRAAVSTSETSTGSFANALPMRVGALNVAAFDNGEIFAAAVFRRALTVAEVSFLVAYYEAG